MAHVCCSDCVGVCRNVCCVAALYVCVRGVMDVVFSVCIVTAWSCRCSCMGSVSVSSTTRSSARSDSWIVLSQRLHMKHLLSMLILHAHHYTTCDSTFYIMYQ